MPVTLWLLYRRMPDSPGFAFGLAASALWLGTIAGTLLQQATIPVWPFVLGSFAFGHLDVDKEVLANNLVLTRFQLVEVVLFDKLHHLREQRVHRGVILQVLNLVDNHNSLIFK